MFNPTTLCDGCGKTFAEHIVSSVGQNGLPDRLACYQTKKGNVDVARLTALIPSYNMMLLLAFSRQTPIDEADTLRKRAVSLEGIIASLKVDLTGKVFEIERLMTQLETAYGQLAAKDRQLESVTERLGNALDKITTLEAEPVVTRTSNASVTADEAAAIAACVVPQTGTTGPRPTVAPAPLEDPDDVEDEEEEDEEAGGWADDAQPTDDNDTQTDPA